jgi:hypothetical protein
MTTTDLTTLVDRLQITEVLHRMGWCQDRKRWADLEQVLAEEVQVGYGGPDVELTPMARSDLVANWRSGLDHTSSQHVLTAITVEVAGDSADATLNETAWLHTERFFGSPVYQFGTAMECGLRRAQSGWKIATLKVMPIWSDGNAAVLGAWNRPGTGD